MTQELDKQLIFRQLVTYSTIIAALVIANSLLIFFMGGNEFSTKQPDNSIPNLRILFIGLGIYFSMRHLSDKIIKIKLTFSKYIFYVFLIAIFFAIADSLYFSIYFKFLSPETITIMKDMMLEQYKQFNFSTDMKNEVVNLLTNPVFLFISQFLADLFTFFVYSLFFGLFYTLLPNKNKTT